MENVTHELRLHDYRKGNNHKDILVRGNEQDCFDYLKIEADKSKCGIGLLTSNGGYEVVNLADEIVRKKKLAGVELYDACKMALQYLSKVNCGDEGDQAWQYLEQAIKKAEA